jgi:hypothetical protein
MAGDAAFSQRLLHSAVCRLTGLESQYEVILLPAQFLAGLLSLFCQTLLKIWLFFCICWLSEKKWTADPVLGQSCLLQQ